MSEAPSISLNKTVIWFVIVFAVVVTTILGLLIITDHVTKYSAANDSGIALGSIAGLSNEQIQQEFSAISKLGFNWIRVDFAWENIQPNNANQFDWNDMDQIVKIASQHHLKILGTLDYAPNWAAQKSCIKTQSDQCPPQNPMEFAKFAAVAAQRYRSSVNVWEIWNEENISKFWSPNPSALQYAQLLKSAYPAIKEASPNSLVIIGGMADPIIDSSTTIDPVKYLQELYRDGAKNSFDAVSYHPYTFPETPLSPNTAWSKMAEDKVSLRSIMISNGDRGKQIWVTEFGAPTSAVPGSEIYVSQTAQSQMVIQSYGYLEEKSWAGPFFWYTYQDASDDAYGLTSIGGTPKIAYSTWRQILSNRQTTN